MLAPSRGLRAAFGLIAVPSLTVLVALSPSPCNAQANTMGRWSPLFRVTEQATDCALLRGNGDSSVVLYYDRSPEARVWLWNAADPTHSPIVKVPLASVQQHEGGHTVLPDGRWLTFGGSDVGVPNSRTTFTFDPTRYWDPVTHGWAPDDPMHFKRIAATGVLLADGTVLAHSGVDHYSLPLFGGRDGSGQLGDLRELASSSSSPERWALRPSNPPPAAREDAAFGFGFLQLVMFGGLDASGPRNDVWLLQRRQDDRGVRWIWSSTLLVSGSTPPPARSGHGMVVHNSYCDSLCDSVWVYGGRDASGQALGDTWLLTYGSAAQSRFRWTSVLPLGEGPGRRHGHTATYDAGPPGAGASYPRMLVFGGRDSTGALCDNRVWSLTLRPPFRWSVLTPATTEPEPRTRHAGWFDNRSRFPVTKPKRMIVFGGEGGAGALADTWFLSRNHTSGSDTTYSWSRNLASAIVPPARARAAFAYEEASDRLLLWGGDSDGGDASSGLLGDLWALGPSLDPGYPALWSSVAQDSAPTPRAGANLVWWPRGSVTVMTPERFDPAAAPGSRWTRLDWATKYDQYLYPYLMLTHTGRVLYAAITDSCAFLDPDPASPTRGWGPRFPSLFSGASAAVVRPDLFMKSGGDQQPAQTGLLEVDSLGNTSGWQAVPGMLPRIDHNTTVLPDGRVLVTGGDAQRKNTALAQRQPQIFDPSNRTWTPGLAPDPAIRGYHSTALLLPDATVMTWAGFVNGTPGDSAAIYSPPYLFSDAAGTPAARPEISFVQDTVAYGQDFALCACQSPAIRSVALVRPKSPTHGFDMNGRFVPLAFTRDPSGMLLSVRSPTHGGIAPPGDYMLFVVDSAGVPSVAQWIRLRAGAPIASSGCPLPCVTDVAPGAERQFRVSPPRPNPALGTTNLGLQLGERTHVTLEILDVQGRLVRVITRGVLSPGEHELRWDGRSVAGHRSAPGVYFARLRVGAHPEQLFKVVRMP